MPGCLCAHIHSVGRLVVDGKAREVAVRREVNGSDSYADKRYPTGTCRVVERQVVWRRILAVSSVIKQCFTAGESLEVIPHAASVILAAWQPTMVEAICQICDTLVLERVGCRNTEGSRPGYGK
jgi:hypothetical protein